MLRHGGQDVKSYFRLFEVIKPAEDNANLFWHTLAAASHPTKHFFKLFLNAPKPIFLSGNNVQAIRSYFDVKWISMAFKFGLYRPNVNAVMIMIFNHLLNHNTTSLLFAKLQINGYYHRVPR